MAPLSWVPQIVAPVVRGVLVFSRKDSVDAFLALESVIGVDRSLDEDDRKLRKDVGLNHRHEGLDDHDEDREGDRHRRNDEAHRLAHVLAEEEDQSKEGQDHHVSAAHVSEQTNHQGEGLDQDADDLNDK